MAVVRLAKVVVCRIIPFLVTLTNDAAFMTKVPGTGRTLSN